ncbi:MAG: hypothetical protein H5U19_10780 [Rhodobacteraceae bacterium]|nr:hypothetical protein [Paracoccaceae bacterium]
MYIQLYHTFSSSTFAFASITSRASCCGFDRATAVIPFLLRGVNLPGIDSVMRPTPDRVRAWNRLCRVGAAVNPCMPVVLERFSAIHDNFPTHIHKIAARLSLWRRDRKGVQSEKVAIITAE